VQHILVLGHRNPDNDSICSAVAYAYLKNQLDPSNVYEAVRLGPLPHETRWVFERYGLEKPVIIQHLHSRVCDAMTAQVICINEDATLLEAGLLMRDRNIRALVVNDAQGSYVGLFSTRMLAELYISDLDSTCTRQEALARPVGAYLDMSALILKPDALISEASNDILASPLREAVVLDEDGVCRGIITRTDIAHTPRRRVILVDHNETAQAAPGIAEAAVLEVVDHHRIGDIQTNAPIQFINLPLGSTATIVTLEFQRHGVPIPAPIAAALLSAVMTDTVLLKSPTTTPVDHEIANYLGSILQEDAQQFGIALFGSREAAGVPTVAAITGADAKEFEVGDRRVLIAQYETVALAPLLERQSELVKHMEKIVSDRGYDFMLLMLTDVVAEGSQFLVTGNHRAVERVFNISLASGSAWLPGILSRKKQVVSRILELA
jgi:manganese-dependent inorganic pyrophosphatase